MSLGAGARSTLPAGSCAAPISSRIQSIANSAKRAIISSRITKDWLVKAKRGLPSPMIFSLESRALARRGGIIGTAITFGIKTAEPGDEKFKAGWKGEDRAILWFRAGARGDLRPPQWPRARSAAKLNSASILPAIR